MYACGPTVYFSTHLGHGSVYVKWDVIRQYLKHWKKYKVTYVQNITDFGHMTSDSDWGEDKIAKGMIREGKSAQEIADYYTNEFHESMDALKIERPDIEPFATKHVPLMAELIKKIIKSGYGYEKNGTVYFDTHKLKNYGKLSGKTLEQMMPGARVTIDLDKKNPQDFVLWAANRPGHVYFWDSQWGKGMPGWHTECVAMSTKYLGVPFDIHTGGFDHFFPHHENEIAQAIAAYGRVHANYWIHAGYLTVDKEKMAKSAGNFTTVLEMLKTHSAEAFRAWIISSHYRSPIELSLDSLKLAREKVDKINRFIEEMYGINAEKGGDFSALIKKHTKKFEDAMDDDFNTPMALSTVFELINEIYRVKDKLAAKDVKQVLALLKKIDAVFKIMNFGPELPELSLEIMEKIREREVARRKKDWKTADRIRAELAKKGVELFDTPEGTKWRLAK